MATKDTPIFICLPVDKKSLMYVEVDPRRLTSAHLTTLYRKDQPSAGGKSKGSGHIVDHGHAHLVQAKPDISELLSLLEEHKNDTLGTIKEADSSLVSETRSTFEALERLITLVNENDHENAGYALGELGHLLMSITSTAAELHRRGTEAREQANSTFEVVSQAHEISDEMETITLEHAYDADNLVTAYDAVSEPLKRLSAKPKVLRTLFQELRTAYADTAEPWLSAYTFFAQGEDCFSIRAFDYENGHIDDAAHADLAEARKHLTNCDTMLKSMEDCKQPLSAEINETLKLITQITPLIAKYREATARFHRHLNRVGLKAVERELISASVYAQAKKLYERSAANIDSMEKEVRVAEQHCRPFMSTEELTISGRVRGALSEGRRVLETLSERPSLAPPRYPSTPRA